ncbi:uncharacterized protein [Argopecten irradians]|uniref:uncharacterized protein isoform X2 n=1 Tax=Argopecten irradians TaxID=31199 RepID=UPI003717A6E3
MSAYCSCTAGLGQTCNHIAAMLFRIEHANRMGFSSAACTSLPCTWNIPGEKVQYGPQQVCDLLPKKSKHGKSASSRPLVSTKKKLFQPITQPPQTNPLESLGEALIDILPKACLFKGYTPKVGSTSMSKNQTERPRDDHNLSSNDANRSAGEEKTNHTDNIQDCYSISEHAKKFTKCEGQAFFATLPRLEEKEILAVAKATGQQSLSPLWHTLRRGRITASRFYAVHTKVNAIKKADKDIDTKPLLKVLKGESGLSDDPAKLPRAMKHGLEMEPTAKVQFYEGNKQHHQNFIVENCGFFIHPTKSFLGASPDMLSSCSCCGEGIVEIKCPVIPPCNTCHTTMCSCSGKGIKYLGYANGNPFLKQNHAYYAQIQGQMAVTGRHFCDFYVYTTYATFQQRILFNSIYWENVCSNLEFFFLKYMVPDMLQASSTDTQTEDDRDVEDMETDDQMGNVFFCPICHQVIKEQENISSFGQRSVCCDLCDKWHHFKCIKMSKASLKSLGDWICSSCNSS